MTAQGENISADSSLKPQKKEKKIASLNAEDVAKATTATEVTGEKENDEILHEQKKPCIASMNLQFIGPHMLDILQSFFDCTREAEEHRLQEFKAVVTIQAAWRRKATILRLKKWNAHAIRIQRWYRGHLHREFASKVRRRVDKFLRLIYFGKHAVCIQRHFRGFYSRKYWHDFYARKAWVDKMVKIGNELRGVIHKAYIGQQEREQEMANKNVQGEINHFIESSHFRVGTESRKGCFYSPLIAIFGRGRSYLEEHIKDAQRQQVTGLELWRKAGYDEYGIPIKVANNKFFVKQSKVPHSKLSIDTRRRVEDAALITSMLGTYITSKQSPYVTKWEMLRHADKEKDLLIPHKRDFDLFTQKKVDYQHLKHPTVRQGSEFGQRERLRKDEQKRLEQEFPNMVKNPFLLHHPSGKVFDLQTTMYSKVFPKRHNHTHFLNNYDDKSRDHRLNSIYASQ